MTAAPAAFPRSASGSDPSLADDDLLRAMLREDAAHGDLTTRALGLSARTCRITFSARRKMVVAGIEEAARLLTLCSVRTDVLGSCGTRVAAGAALLSGTGCATGVFAAWKTAQTLAEAMSGIASAVARMAAAAASTGRRVPIACTRKSFPGTRIFSARAVVAGGGILHRLGASETLLVFPQHLALVPAAEHAVRLASLRSEQPEKRLVVEVCSHDDALAYARAGAEILQLERFSPDAVRPLRTALDRERLDVKLAAAGGVTETNAADYARAGADLLVTSAPYFAPPADVAVAIEPLPQA